MEPHQPMNGGQSSSEYSWDLVPQQKTPLWCCFLMESWKQYRGGHPRQQSVPQREGAIFPCLELSWNHLPPKGTQGPKNDVNWPGLGEEEGVAVVGVWVAVDAHPLCSEVGGPQTLRSSPCTHWLEELSAVQSWGCWTGQSSQDPAHCLPVSPAPWEQLLIEVCVGLKLQRQPSHANMQGSLSICNYWHL